MTDEKSERRSTIDEESERHLTSDEEPERRSKPDEKSERRSTTGEDAPFPEIPAPDELEVFLAEDDHVLTLEDLQSPEFTFDDGEISEHGAPRKTD